MRPEVVLDVNSPPVAASRGRSRASSYRGSAGSSAISKESWPYAGRLQLPKPPASDKHWAKRPSAGFFELRPAIPAARVSVLPPSHIPPSRRGGSSGYGMLPSTKEPSTYSRARHHQVVSPVAEREPEAQPSGGRISASGADRRGRGDSHNLRRKDLKEHQRWQRKTGRSPGKATQTRYRQDLAPFHRTLRRLLSLRFSQSGSIHAEKTLSTDRDKPARRWRMSSGH